MTKPEWSVLEHGPIQRLEENLWAVEGFVPNFPIQRRMAVARLEDGSLVVHSAICLEEAAQRELEAFGTVRYVIVPNAFHRIDAPRYAARYPDATIVCPDPSRKAVAKRTRVDGNPTLIPKSDGFSAEPLAGSGIQEHVLKVRSSRGVTLVFNDTLFNLPKLPGFKGWLYGLIGSTGGPKVTPLMRVAAIRDKKALRAHLERLAETPGLRRVLPGHGFAVEGEAECRAMLLTAASGL